MSRVLPSRRWIESPSRVQPKDEYKALKQELEKGGKKVIDLRLGDPVQFRFTNQTLSNSLIQASREGWHMYPGPTEWQSKLKKAIADFEKTYRKVRYSPKEIILAPGVAGALHVLHYTLLDAGDEIVAFDPSHYLSGPTSYWAYFGARVVPCGTIEAEGWMPDIEELRASISDKTKGIFINSPNNPTGAVYDEKILKDIIDVAGEYNLPIFSDEIYGLMTFDGIEARSAASITEDVPVIVLSGMSKMFMGPGWRLGYMCFHDPQGKIAEVANIARKVSTAYGHMSKCIPLPILVAATRTYQGSIKALRQMMDQLKINKDFTWKRLNEINGIICTEPRGAFYAFPRVEAIRRTWNTEEEFLIDLLKEEGIMFVGGSKFSRLGYGHFRTLLLPRLELLEEVYNKLERFLIRHAI